jgi:ABC-type uncharacterized transport system fused permease/ATPase subunit
LIPTVATVVDDDLSSVGAKPLRRFWRTARGFWAGDGAWIPWALIGFLVIGVVAQLVVQYRLNIWNRDFFNALERRDGKDILQQAYLLPALAASSIVLAAAAVWGRMSFQRLWREWLTLSLVELWLSHDNYRRLDAGQGEPQFAEYRIAEDARIATDAPIDLLVGLLSSVLTAATFVVVLWTVGGSLRFTAFGVATELPGYLVFASIVYAMITTGAMMLVGRKMAHVIERKNQAESELKFAVARLRGSPPAAAAGADESVPVGFALGEVMRHWRHLCGQHVRTTLVSHGNTLLAPLVGLILCVPQYLTEAMSLGEVTQAAAAFAAVQGAFNWLVDNYPRLAEWASSASRVGILLLGLDLLASAQPNPNVRRPLA